MEVIARTLGYVHDGRPTMIQKVSVQTSREKREFKHKKEKSVSVVFFFLQTYCFFELVTSVTFFYLRNWFWN